MYIIGDLEGATKELRKAIQLDPIFSEGFHILGAALMKNGCLKKGLLGDIISPIPRHHQNSRDA